LFSKIAVLMPGAGPAPAAQQDAAAPTGPSDEAENQALRWEEAVKEMGGDESLLLDAAQTLLDDAPRLMSKVRSAVERGDPQALQSTSHLLKGSVRPFGAPRAFEFAFRLETMGRRRDLNAAAETLKELEQEMENLLEGLRGQVSRAPR
jgi:HPt (histidine-containing phosphotransfer) domain-containing protein